MPNASHSLTAQSEIHAMPPGEPTGGMADRFIAFAFAAADLLVETDMDGIVSFATGAFRSRLGAEGASFVGRPAAHLFHAEDGVALESAFAEARERGRIPPMLIRLANGMATPASMGVMMMPPQGGRMARMCLAIGLVATAPRAAEQRLPGLQTAASFGRIAEQVVRTGEGGTMSLVEVKGLPQPGRGTENERALHSKIDMALTQGAPGVTAGMLGNGRYGLVSPTEIDINAVIGRLEATLQEQAGHADTTVEGSSFGLGRGNLTTAQAARALRYALGRFVEAGTSGTAEAGGTQGLAGIIANAESRARSMRESIAARRFRMAYQPVVRLSDRATHHYEALLRPASTENGPVQSTQDFVTFAEAVGLSEELDWAVLETVIDALSRSTGSAATIAVNMSGLSIQNPEFRKKLLSRMREIKPLLARPKAGMLIELTETAEIEDMDGAAHTIDALRAQGVGVCLDDFGVGSAALRYLRKFKVDFVKIDGIYVQGAVTNPQDRTFVTSIVDIATQAGAKVVAEKIETEEQAAIMRAEGVQFGQGWLYGRPGHLPGQL